jgi:hypothetical protein
MSGLKSVAGYRFIGTNLPYREQAAIRAHLLPISTSDGVHMAVTWQSWRARSGARPRVRPAIASPPLVQLVRLVVGAARARPRPLSALRWPSTGSSAPRSRNGRAVERRRVSLYSKHGLIGRTRRLTAEGHIWGLRRTWSGKPVGPEAGIGPARPRRSVASRIASPPS